MEHKQALNNLFLHVALIYFVVKCHVKPNHAAEKSARWGQQEDRDQEKGEGH